MASVGRLLLAGVVFLASLGTSVARLGERCIDGESCKSQDQTQVTGVCVDGAYVCHDGWDLDDCSRRVDDTLGM